MWIESFRHDLWPWSKSPGLKNVGGTRAVKFGGAVPLHERLLLAGLLLIVTGWIILRLVLMLLAAH